MEGEPQAGGKDLEVGGLESPSKTAEKKAAVAGGWILYKASSGKKKSCLELRFCHAQDNGWPGRADPGHYR